MHWLDRINPQIHHLWHGEWKENQIEPSRWLYDHLLVVVTKGTCEVIIEERPYICPPFSYIIIPPDMEHTSKVIGSDIVSRHCFHFDWQYKSDFSRTPLYTFSKPKLNRSLIRYTPDFIPRKIFYGNFEKKEAISILLESMIFTWKIKKELYPTGRAHLLEILLGLLSPMKQNLYIPNHELDLAFKIRDLLDRTIEFNDSIQNRLELLKYSYAHLCRIFRKHFDITPVGYVNSVRIEKAKQMLKDSKQNISETAFSLGFNSPDYFARLFRKNTGMRPRDYRTTIL